MVDVPRSLEDKLIEAKIRQQMIENLPPPEFGPGAARAFFGEGLGMGWGDEAEAQARAMRGEGEYRDLVKGIRKDYGRFADYYPKSSAALEFAGGAAPALASYALSALTGGTAAPAAAATTARSVGALGKLAAKLSENPYLRGGTIGFGQGAITGAGQAEDTSNLPMNVVGGGGVGTVIGAGAPVVLRGSRGLWNWAKERAAPSDKFIEQRALDRMTNALEAEDIQPRALLDRAIEDQRLGVPGLLANANESFADLADVVAQRSGRANRLMRTALSEQKEGSQQRVMDQVRRGISGGSYFQDEADAVAKLRRGAGQAYEDAYAFGAVDDPRLIEVLKSPKFAEFFERAKKIADTDALTAKLNGENPDKFKLKELYTINKDKDGNITGFELVDVPDVRTLDYIKRGIDDAIEAGYKGGSSSKQEASSNKDLRKAFVKVIDEATTDPQTGRSAYVDARKLYAGDMEVLDAMRMGYDDFGKLAHEEIGMLMKGMSDAEKEAFRSGAVRNIYNILMVPSNQPNSGKKLVGSPEMRAKISELFESDAKRDLFMAAAERERELFEQANRIMAGSPTIRRGVMKEQFDEGSNVGEAIAASITGGPKNALMTMAAKAVSSIKMSDEVAEAMARKLRSNNPIEVAEVVQQLEDYAVLRAGKMERLSASEQGIGSGTNVSFYPAPVDEEAAREEAKKDITRGRPQPDMPVNLEEELAAWRKRTGNE